MCSSSVNKLIRLGHDSRVLHFPLPFYFPFFESLSMYTHTAAIGSPNLNKCSLKNGVFWDVTPCGSCKNRRFHPNKCSLLRFFLDTNL
jgi:hypothetical protein